MLMNPVRFVLPAVVLVLAELASNAAAAPPATRPVLHVAVDASAAPDLAAEGEKLKATAEGEYPRLCRELASPGYTPIDTVTIKFADIGPPAYTTWGGRDGVITCQIKWFTDHPDDLGCIVHELTHVVQHYTLNQPPGWVTEGIADWTRWFVFEPASARPHPNPDKAKYDDSYRTTAAFLNWCQNTYDRHLVQQLNTASRTGHYRPALWQQLTGRSLDQLGDEWKRSLPARRGRPATRPVG